MRLGRAAVLLSFAGAACTSYSSTAVVDGGGDDAAGGATDGAVVDASLRNAGFEEEGVACAPGWTTLQATSDVSSTFHSGARSCRVCSTQATSLNFSLTTVVDGTSGQWVVRAFAHADDQSPAPRARIALSALTADGGVAKMTEQSVAIADAGAWTPLQTSLIAPDGTTRLRVLVGGVGAIGTCVLVDDVDIDYTP